MYRNNIQRSSRSIKNFIFAGEEDYIESEIIKYLEERDNGYDFSARN